MDDEVVENALKDISKSVVRSQRHLKSIADCLRVITAMVLIGGFFAFQHLYKDKGHDIKHAANDAAKNAAEVAKDAGEAVAGSAAGVVAIPTPAPAR